MTAPTPADKELLDFLYQRVNYERMLSPPHHANEFKLDRMRELLARLGNPQTTFAVIHVAGTKGKGSVSATVGAILLAANYQVGVFTSPHLDRIEERLAINGQNCSHQEFIDLLRQVRPIVEAMGDAPTFFEIITAMALLYFAAHQVDVAVLEVGLGGRLDSTNVCRPCVAVITSISFDHMQQLGTTLEAIAAEKAGIVKPAIPVISGVTEETSRQVIRNVCRQQQSPLDELNVDFCFDYTPALHLEEEPALGHITFMNAQREVIYCDLELALLGRHQAANAAVALAAIQRLIREGWTIPEFAVRTGLASLTWPARVEIVSRHPAVIIDAAHNEASAQALLETLSESFRVRRRHLLFATTREKDISGMLRRLLSEFDTVVFTQYTGSSRAVPPAELAAEAHHLTGRQYAVFENPTEAWNTVCQQASPDDLICVTGSFFIATQMRKLALMT